MRGPRCTCTLLAPNSDPESQGLLPDPRQNRTRSCPLRSHEQSELPAPTLLGARWDPQEFVLLEGLARLPGRGCLPGLLGFEDCQAQARLALCLLFPKRPRSNPGSQPGPPGRGPRRPAGPPRTAQPGHPPPPPPGRELSGAVLGESHHSSPAAGEAGSGCPGRRKKRRSWTQSPRRRRGEDKGRS